MKDIYVFLQKIGSTSLDIFWFPISIWTGIAFIAFLVLRFSKNLNPLYQYHLRVATLAAIPFGLLSTYLASLIRTTSISTTNFDGAIFVVQTPIEFQISPNTSTNIFTPNWTDPSFLIGIATLFVCVISLISLGRLVYSYFTLKRLHQSLDKVPLNRYQEFDDVELTNIQLAYYEHPLVPFTFGWRTPIIVLPKSIQDNPEKVRMAIQHELVHIKRGDYLLQLGISVITSLFWFHPLVRVSSDEIETYREISCDQEVLNTTGISLKNYASMLFELLPLNRGFGSFSINMAVQDSTLKKRIKTMKYHSMYKTSIKRSLFFLALMIVGVTLPIACSDMRGVEPLDEAELESLSLTLTSPTVTINGEEIASNASNVTITGMDGYMLAVKEYGVFAISAQPFEGARLNGEISASTIEFKVNELNVTISSNNEISDIDVPVFVNHYPDLASEQFIYGKLASTILQKSDLASYLIPPNSNTSMKAIPEDMTFLVVEQMPVLIGGMESIQSRITYPKEARELGIEGRVMIKFIVDKDGNVVNPQITRGIGGGADEEALAAVMQAKFEPGMQRGREVNVEYSIPVVFRLSDSEFTEVESEFQKVLKEID